MPLHSIESIIRNIQPDKIDEDGSVYYFPFKLVPVINLIKKLAKAGGKADASNDMYFQWASKAGLQSVLAFRMMTKNTDEYLPVGDVVFKGAIGLIFNNIYSGYEQLLEAKVLFVKNDPKYSKILSNPDFVQIDDDSGSGISVDISLYAASSRNSQQTPQQVGDYFILSDLVSGYYKDGLNLNPAGASIRTIAAVHKNYVRKIEGFNWGSSLGIGDWNGIQNSTSILYSSPFINTFFADGYKSGNRRYPFIFFDIKPESISRRCCSDDYPGNLSSYCSNQDPTFCRGLMNDFCSKDNLKMSECISWCNKSGVYCDDKLYDYCSNVNLEDINMPVTPSTIKYNFKKVGTSNVTGQGGTLLSVENKTDVNNCQTKCQANIDCDAFVFNVTDTNCSMYKSVPEFPVESNLMFSSNTDTYVKDKSVLPDKVVNRNICSCFKNNEYYNDFFNTAIARYPDELKSLLLASSGSRDKRCFYPDCTSGYYIKHRNFRDQQASCGDNNIQICFQNISNTGSTLKDSTLENQQRINCSQSVEKAIGKTIDTPSSQTVTGKYSCSSDYKCELRDNGVYESENDCTRECVKPQTTKEETETDNTNLYIIIAVVVLFLLLVIGVVLLM